MKHKISDKYLKSEVYKLTSLEYINFYTDMTWRNFTTRYLEDYRSFSLNKNQISPNHLLKTGHTNETHVINYNNTKLLVQIPENPEICMNSNNWTICKLVLNDQIDLHITIRYYIIHILNII